MAKQPTDSTSESENPAIPSPEPKTGHRPRSNKDWWPKNLNLDILHQHDAKTNPMGDGFERADRDFRLGEDRVRVDEHLHGGRVRLGDRRQQIVSIGRVAVHDLPLFVRQWPRFEQDRVRYPHFANIVQPRASPDVRQFLLLQPHLSG